MPQHNKKVHPVPINYDFGKNWDSEIKPLLKKPEVIASIEECKRCYVRDRYSILSEAERDHILKTAKTLADVSGTDFVPMLLEDMRERKIRNTKYGIQNYILIGSCHWINPTFSLTLARIIFPAEKWEIVESDDHTSVFNEQCTMCFDILAWAFFSKRKKKRSRSRLEELVLMMKNTHNDHTFGGIMAYETTYLSDTDVMISDDYMHGENE